MKITAFEIYSYKIPIVTPLTMKGFETSHREGLFIRLTGDNDNYGWGEISPLPGFSPETFKEIIEHTRQLKYQLNGADIPYHLEELSGGFDRWLKDFKLSASVRCGFEMAVLYLIADSRECALAEILSDTSAKSIAVNALLSGSDENVITKAKGFTQAGFKTVKLKVGRRSLDDDITLTQKVREAIGEKNLLRLDANRAWTMDEAVVFAAGVKKYDVEYIEEPLRNPAGLADFYERTGVPVALDESLRETTPDKIDIPEGDAALILKPTLLGGFENAMRYVRRAIQKKVKNVISSSFETPLGLCALAHLAAALGETGTAHGLGTAKRFREADILFPFNVEKGIISIYPANPAFTPVRVIYLKDV